MRRRRRRPFTGAGDTTEGEKDRGARGTHHESIPAVGSSGGRPEKRIDGGATLQAPPMVTGGGWAIPAGEKPDWGFGKVEEVPRNVPMQGIKVWWAEEGDRR